MRKSTHTALDVYNKTKTHEGDVYTRDASARATSRAARHDSARLESCEHWLRSEARELPSARHPEPVSPTARCVRARARITPPPLYTRARITLARSLAARCCCRHRCCLPVRGDGPSLSPSLPSEVRFGQVSPRCAAVWQPRISVGNPSDFFA